MECACGCGGITAGGNFLPGHDQRLRAELERRVGGLISARQKTPVFRGNAQKFRQERQ